MNDTPPAASCFEIQKQVEKMGIFFEKSGFPPIAARIFGYLLLASPPHQTFEALQKYLKCSKSAVSNGLHFLENQQLIQYITFTGDRKRYFKLNYESWLSLIKQRIGNVAQFKCHIKECLLLRDQSAPDFNQVLSNAYDLHTLIETQLTELIEKWENLKK